jgi:hypothetical protein
MCGATGIVRGQGLIDRHPQVRHRPAHRLAYHPTPGRPAADRRHIVGGRFHPPPHPRQLAAPQLLAVLAATGGWASHPIPLHRASLRSTPFVEEQLCELRSRSSSFALATAARLERSLPRESTGEWAVCDLRGVLDGGARVAGGTGRLPLESDGTGPLGEQLRDQIWAAPARRAPCRRSTACVGWCVGLGRPIEEASARRIAQRREWRVGYAENCRVSKSRGVRRRSGEGRVGCGEDHERRRRDGAVHDAGV